MRQLIAVTVLAWGVTQSPSSGQLIKFEQKAAWLDTMSGITEIPFTGFPKGTDITDQYKDLGVLFVDGNDFVIHSELIFPQDHWGLLSNFTPVHLIFSEPQTSIAIDYPGHMRMSLFTEGEHVVSSNFQGDELYDNFAAMLLIEETFDEVIIARPNNEADVFLDTILFTASEPRGGDVNGDGVVDVDDLIEVILNWGFCPPIEGCGTPADLNGDDRVHIEDIQLVLLNWTE